MQNKFLTILILVLFFSKLVVGQMSQPLYVFEDLPQNNFENPAQMNNAEWTLSLPFLSGLSVNFYSPLTFNQLGKTEHGTLLKLDVDKITQKIPSTNSINQSLDIPIFTFTISKKKHQYSFAWVERQNLSIYSNNDLFELASIGNSIYTGEQTPTPNAGFYFNSYHEFSAGYTIQKNRKLTFGTHAKLLFGSYNIQTRASKVVMNTKADLTQQEFDLKAHYNISGIPLVITNNKIEPIDFSSLLSSFFSLKNIGAAFDFGLNYKINRISNISIAINNIGLIRWRNKPFNYSANGTFIWEGINLNDVIDNHTGFEKIKSDIISSFNNSITDTITNLSYFSLVNPNILAHYSKRISPQIEISVLNRTTLFHNRIKNSLSFIGKYQFNKSLALSSSYSIINQSIINLGAAIYSNHRKFDFYIGTNNLLWFASNSNFKSANLTFGCNLKLQNIIDPFYLSLERKRKMSYKRQRNWYKSEESIYPIIE